MDEAQSAISTSAGMPHHVTGTIAEEEQEGGEEDDQQGADPNWPAAAAAAAAAGTEWPQVGARGVPGGVVGGEHAVEAGQNWNWAWLAGQLPPELGALDPSTLLDDESEGEIWCSQNHACLLQLYSVCCNPCAAMSC